MISRSIIDKRDCLLVSRSALKGMIAELEIVLGIDAAWPVTSKALEAVQATDELLREIR